MKAAGSIGNVRHSAQGWGNIYRGTREGLIAAGVANPDWFPAQDVPSTKRSGRIKRSFRFTVHDQKVKLNCYAPKADRWEVCIEFSEEERRKAEARWQAEMEERRSRENDAGQRTLESITLAKMTREEMNDQQLRVVAKLWTLSERRWGVVMSILDDLLVMDAKAGALGVPQRPARRLELVVDNGSRRGT